MSLHQRKEGLTLRSYTIGSDGGSLSFAPTDSSPRIAKFTLDDKNLRPERLTGSTQNLKCSSVFTPALTARMDGMCFRVSARADLWLARCLQFWQVDL